MPFLSRIAIPDSCRSNFLPFYHHPPHAFLLPRSLSRRWKRSPKLPCPLRVGVRFWASLTLRKLANASGRIVFNIALFMDWQFISGCLPPRLSTTQFPSTTDSQCSVRWGLPPHGWCALSGARRDALLRDPALHVQGKPPANVTKRVPRNSKKKRRDIQRRSASLPAPAKWLGPVTSSAPPAGGSELVDS